ncbi:hypothetical protein Micbo1qcDRAFT_158601, partial [Microdochium bolleyi]
MGARTARLPRQLTPAQALPCLLAARRILINTREQFSAPGYAQSAPGCLCKNINFDLGLRD